MKHTIGNDHLQVSVQQKGAELCSLKYKGIEYIWQADPTIWGSHAPVLFPIVGGLKQGHYTHEGKTYSLPKHGIIRHNDKLSLLEQTESHLQFSFTANEESLQNYPFNFYFSIGFTLAEKGLIISHQIENRGDVEMFFSLGAHPAFRCPLIEEEVYEDYYLEFEQAEDIHRWDLNKEGLIEGKGTKVLNNSQRLPLTHQLFENDALIFKNLQSRSLTLCSQRAGKLLSVHFEGWPYLGIWAKPNGDFVCIEPWMGLADNTDTNGLLTEKEGSCDSPLKQVLKLAIPFYYMLKHKRLAGMPAASLIVNT